MHSFHNLEFYKLELNKLYIIAYSLSQKSLAYGMKETQKSLFRHYSF